VKDKKNDQSICVNDAEEGEAGSDVLYKVNIKTVKTSVTENLMRFP
jgi:hypothetical protein